MAAYPLDKQTAGCNSPHDWLMSLAMDLTALCDMWSENDTNGCHLAGFSQDVAFARRFVASHPPSHPAGVLLILATPVKKLSKLVGNSASYSPNSWWIDRL